MRSSKRLLRLLLTTAAAATVAAATIAGPASAATTINGAGATFPYPLYTSWAGMYKAKTGVKLNYQGIGSGGGISAIKAGTVHFGASDAPLTPAELSQAGLVQYPMTIGGVVPVVNLSGVKAGKMKLTGAVLAQIYLGEITTWNDKRIKKLNPGLKLPATAITVVHRSDSSGTSFIFTNYLSAVSKTWKTKVGAGKSVSWPTGVGGKGNEGVAAVVKQAKGRIGYVEYAYAKQGRIPWTQLMNRSKKWIIPSVRSFTVAAASATYPARNGFASMMVNAGGTGWPITGATYILVKKNNSDYATTHAMLKFFDWAYKDAKAKSKANALSYVNIPSKAVKSIQTMWRNQIKAGGKRAW